MNALKIFHSGGEEQHVKIVRIRRASRDAARRHVRGRRSQGDKPITKQNQVTVTATIKAIDPATRSITLRAENGDEDTFTVGPDVTRFDQLKAGDTIKATYYESLVFQVRKPGTPAPTSGTGLAAGRLKDAPGGASGSSRRRP